MRPKLPPEIMQHLSRIPPLVAQPYTLATTEKRTNVYIWFTDKKYFQEAIFGQHIHCPERNVIKFVCVCGGGYWQPFL